ncbi:MAG: signal peptidase I [Cyanobacteria bacterium SBLK]|nr:signal peptidase I [Cyanobacteria bacterium SBLK]
MLNRKDPWLGVNLSLFFPGLGQIYAGKIEKGGIFLAVHIGLMILTLWSIFAPRGSLTIALFYLFLAAILYLANLFDAFRCLDPNPNNPQAEKIPRTRKNPWFAVLLSRILPGLGQFYLQNAVLGGLFLGLTIILSFADDFWPILSPIASAIAALSAYHAYCAFPQKSPLKNGRTLIANMAIAILIGGILTRYIPLGLSHYLEIFVVPSSSMQPTLHIGDRILVTKFASYRPQPGDLVVFVAPERALALDPKLPPNEEIFFVKRAIASGGQTVKVTGGLVYVNDRPIRENYALAPSTYELPPQQIPPQSYWVLGDNRNNSFDSHIWGVLPAENIIGRAYKIIFPLGRSRSLLPR